jgi:Uma2 family endonuclease
MTAAHRLNLISVEDYLAGELVSQVKHEYLGGVVYAMAGAANLHNMIVMNIGVALQNRLRGKQCRAFNSDTKIRVRLPSHTRFYYPDVSVICRSNAPDESFQDEPAVIIEVLSDSTRRIDEGEKRDAYLTIPSLQVYLLVKQDSPAVVAYRRSDQFLPALYKGLDAVVSLDDVGCELPLSEIYETIEFPRQTPDEV